MQLPMKVTDDGWYYPCNPFQGHGQRIQFENGTYQYIYSNLILPLLYHPGGRDRLVHKEYES